MAENICESRCLYYTYSLSNYMNVLLYLERLKINGLLICFLGKYKAFFMSNGCHIYKLFIMPNDSNT